MSAAKSRASEYEKKRDFKKSSEPRGGKKRTRSGRSFVIHAHDASTMHYDFRIEIDGALKSWSVPKGPSTDPSEKRLAIPTEDHPLEYADFEGVIPEGEYGAGPVQVWDRGTYRNLLAEKDDDEKSMTQAFDDGKLEVWLEGEKLTGGYAMTKMSGRKEWLLIKMDDDEADRRRNPVSTEKKSVASGRTLDEIKKEG